MGALPDDDGLRFRPLRPASHRRRLVGMIVGPLLWLGAVLLAAALTEPPAIAIGVIVAGLAFMAAVLVLSLLRLGRDRQERRYADRG